MERGSDLVQLVKVLESEILKLEKYHKSNDTENFNKSKKTILHIQEMILRALK